MTRKLLYHAAKEGRAHGMRQSKVLNNTMASCLKYGQLAETPLLQVSVCWLFGIITQTETIADLLFRPRKNLGEVSALHRRGGSRQRINFGNVNYELSAKCFQIVQGRQNDIMTTHKSIIII